MKKVLMINWDCYPNIAYGGVYVWVKNLIDSMSDYEFIVIDELSHPNSNANYVIPPNVTKVIEVPIFGCFRYEEFLKRNEHLVVRIMRTKEETIKELFIPLYKEFLMAVLSERCDSSRIADLVIKLHDFFKVYDPKKCLEHPLAWEVFLDYLNKDPIYNRMNLKETVNAFQAIQKSINMLSIEIPKVDIIHSALAWLPSLAAVYAKKESNCPLIITEHGLAFRDQLLTYNGYIYDDASRIFWKVFTRNVVLTMYSVADLVTPVCDSNKLWEESLGADPRKIKVIYNGINTSKFRPIDIQREDKRPTVVCVSRLDVLKDVVCIIQAIKQVKMEIPEIQCLLYGGSADLEYALKCISVVKELQLEDTVKFMGPTKEPERAFNSADVVAYSGISEGFPFTIIEAMACGKAIVASDIGGVREALEGCGILVRNRQPYELAKGIVKLLKDENLRRQFEVAALKKATDEFGLERCCERFRKVYEEYTVRYERVGKEQEQKEVIAR